MLLKVRKYSNTCMRAYEYVYIYVLLIKRLVESLQPNNDITSKIHIQNVKKKQVFRKNSPKKEFKQQVQLLMNTCIHW